MEMAVLIGDEARRIRFTQNALVKAGINKAPTPSEIRRAEVFEDAERLIYAIQPVRDQVHKILAPVIAAMATADNFPRTEPEPPAPEPDDAEQSID
jgi:hypothetical protein